MPRGWSQPRILNRYLTRLLGRWMYLQALHSGHTTSMCNLVDHYYNVITIMLALGLHISDLVDNEPVLSFLFPKKFYPLSSLSPPRRPSSVGYGSSLPQCRQECGGQCCFLPPRLPADKSRGFRSGSRRRRVVICATGLGSIRSIHHDRLQDGSLDRLGNLYRGRGVPQSGRYFMRLELEPSDQRANPALWALGLGDKRESPFPRNERP